ncbi:MAG: helix-turn-helix domain-containing protein [Acidimicrobiales bacterium]
MDSADSEEKPVLSAVTPLRRGARETAGNGAGTGAGGNGIAGEREGGGGLPDDLDHIVSSIGPKLRELRLQQRLSMQQLADRADVSAAAIHKIERSGMVPTITTLLKLAGALDRPVSYFVEEDGDESRPVIFTPAAARGNVYTAHRGIDLEGISGPYGRFFVAGAIATVDPGADSGPTPMEHPGEELVFVLDGVLEFTVEDQRWRLQKGDAIHFRTDRRHQWHNPGNKDAKAVWMALRPG